MKGLVPFTLTCFVVATAFGIMYKVVAAPERKIWVCDEHGSPISYGVDWLRLYCFYNGTVYVATQTKVDESWLQDRYLAESGFTFFGSIAAVCVGVLLLCGTYLHMLGYFQQKQKKQERETKMKEMFKDVRERLIVKRWNDIRESLIIDQDYDWRDAGPNGRHYTKKDFDTMRDIGLEVERTDEGWRFRLACEKADV